MFWKSDISPYAVNMSKFEWQNKAECRRSDPELFFVGDTKLKSPNNATDEAKKLCGACAVKMECLRYALHNDEQSGIWGNMVTEERMALKRRMRRSGSSVV